VSLLGLTLSACKANDLFSQLSTSDVEQAAGESISLSEQKELKLARMEAKKEAFPTYIDLVTKGGETTQMTAIAYRNRYDLDQQSVIDIEAILPSPEQSFYEAWLVGDDPQNPIRLGVFEYKSEDDYILTYKTQEDLSNINQVFITRETTSDDEPETAIMAGEFESSKEAPVDN